MDGRLPYVSTENLKVRALPRSGLVQKVCLDLKLRKSG